METTEIMDKKFDYACNQVKRLRERPTDAELLVLYGYYKQAILGDNPNPKPNILYLKERKKWNIWNDLKGLSTEQAKIEYYNQVQKLIVKYGTTALV
jgi:diazepam-binding inhibitor (GABA receptor modulating acyl-CoA-binding protein)